MKVFFVNTVYAPNEIGGAERTVRTLAEELIRRGHRAVVASIAPDGEGASGDIGGVRTHYLPLANLYWPHRKGAVRRRWQKALWHLIDAYNPIMEYRLGKLLDMERPDVIQMDNLQGFSVAAWRAAKARNIPIVHMLHDYYLGCRNSSMFRQGANCESQCRSCHVLGSSRRWFSNDVDAVISLSRRSLERIEACGLFTKVPRKEVIHGGSSYKLSTAARPRRNPGAPVRFGYLGRLEPVKGIDVLLKAASNLPADRMSVVLGGSGAADYVSALRNEFPAPNMRFLGTVKPADFFAQIDVLVVPSLWEEPLGRVIYEGYAHGVPSIVSRAGGMPEIVDEDQTGYVVPAGDAGALEAAMRRLIDSEAPIDRFYDACRSRAGDFSIEGLFDRYMDVWRSSSLQAG